MKMPNRFLFQLLPGLLFALCQPGSIHAGEAPNVVIILADDLGIGDVSSYNEHSAWKTPNIDKLAANGMSFTDAHTSGALCTPTRYGIMTGRYNWRSRLKRGGFSGYSRPLIDNDRVTIAELFRSRGYETAIVGKWHLGWDWALKADQIRGEDEPNASQIDFAKPARNGPEELGFAYSYCLAASLSSPPYVYVENSLPIAIPTETTVNYDEKALWKKGPKAADFKHARALGHLTDKSVEYIREQAGSKQPFFLYVAFTAPHAPIIPTTEFIGKSNANAYGDFVLQVDAAAGRIVEAVTTDNRLRNTIIFFTSDNGQSPRADFHDDELRQAGHNGSYIYRGKKFDIYEGGHRVPFIANWPGQIAAGTKSDETICTVDFMATAADLLNIKLPDDAAEDSTSFLPVLTQKEYRKPLREATVHHSNDGRFAIRRGDWKLILWPGSGGWAFPKTEEEMKGLPRFQLYNLKKDPSEKTNLVAEHPDMVHDLKSLLTKYIEQGRSTPGAPQQNDGPERWSELEWMDDPDFGTLIFQDDFNRSETQEIVDEPGNDWTTSSDKTADGRKQVDLRDGAMYMHTAENANHAVSVRHAFEFTDGTIEMRVMLENEGDLLKLNFADMELKTVHAGHLFDANVGLDEVSFEDKKTGIMDLKIRAANQAGTLSEEKKQQLSAKKKKRFPHAIAKGEWHLLQVHVSGDEISAVIDGVEVGRFRSEGMAHPTKRLLRLLTTGHSVVDDVKIWRKDQ